VAPKGRASETSRTKVLVIGAGQAGLAASHELKRAGIGFLLIDAGSVIGDSWRKRYDTLTLFTPRSISSLKGMSLPGDPEGYATKDEFADYLAEYAVKDGHGAIMATRIASLRKIDETFEATTTDRRTFIADAVIVAAGAFQSPRIPTISSSLSPHVQQIHVANFQTASSVKDGPVLVVGDGASGRDVAAALASKHVVALSRGRRRKLFPERIFGRSTWQWLQWLGLLKASAGSLVGRRMRRIDPFPNRGNDDASLARIGIDIRPRLKSFDGSSAVFSDGTRMEPGTIVWATGYVDDFEWIAIDGAVDTDGVLLHREGVSPIPGLYFLGRPWQRNRASALIAGAGDDAAFVVAHLSSRMRSPPRGR